MNRTAQALVEWLGILVCLFGTLNCRAQERTLVGLGGSEYSPELQTLLDHSIGLATNAIWTNRLEGNQVAGTLVDLTTPDHPRWASSRGSELIYPASVVKLFYLVATHRWLEDRKLEDTPELRRAMRDMIVESYNEATHYIVDLLTGTTSGPELAPDTLRDWFDRRNAVNRYFASLGFRGINASKKPWCEGPYGREMQATKAFEPRRNFLTTDTTARLLAEIALGRAISPDRSRQMMELLARDPSTSTSDPDDQAHGFTGLALKPGMKLWSKAGWTSDTRHDAAYIELANGARLVLVVFTVDHANERKIIPMIAAPILTEFSERKR